MKNFPSIQKTEIPIKSSTVGCAFSVFAGPGSPSWHPTVSSSTGSYPSLFCLAARVL